MKPFPLIMVLLASVTFVIASTSSSSINFLTKARADTFYCQINGACNLSVLNVNNITVYNVSDIQDEHWVNQSGDSMSGNLRFDDNVYLYFGTGNDYRMRYYAPTNKMFFGETYDSATPLEIQIRGVYGADDSAANGGNIDIAAGAGASEVSLANGGDGGNLTLRAGSGGISAGMTSGDAGHVLIRGGDPAPGLSQGEVWIQQYDTDETKVYGDLNATGKICDSVACIGDTSGTGFTNNSHIDVGFIHANRTNTGSLVTMDAAIGNTGGSLQIGSSYIVEIDDLIAAGMNLSDTMIFRNSDPTSSNASFVFATADNLIRFLIPKSGYNLGSYNPRSMMIGGDLGQAFDDKLPVCLAQGYTNIDCDTSGTGADLGIQDDLEVHGTVYGSEQIQAQNLSSPHIGNLHDTSNDYTRIWGYDTGAGNWENIRIQWTPTFIDIGSDTGIVQISWSMSFKLADDFNTAYGASNDVRFLWETDQTQDYFLINIARPSGSNTGSIVLASQSLWDGYKDPQTGQWSGHPEMQWKADHNSFNSRGRIWHNGTDFNLQTPEGNITLSPATNVTMTSLKGSYTNGEAYVCVTDSGTIYAKDSACS